MKIQIGLFIAAFLSASAGPNGPVYNHCQRDCKGDYEQVEAVGVIQSANYPVSNECDCYAGFTLYTFDRTEVAITFDEFHLNVRRGDFVAIYCGYNYNILMKNCTGDFCPQVSCAGTGKWMMKIEYYIHLDPRPAYFKATFYKHNLAASFPPVITSTTTTLEPKNSFSTPKDFTSSGEAGPTTEAPNRCADLLVDCSLEKCAAEPGNYLCQCRKTCNYCAGTEACMDNPDFPCALMQEYCSLHDISNVCPQSCDSCPICSPNDEMEVGR